MTHRRRPKPHRALSVGVGCLGLLLASAGTARALGCSPNARAELIDGFYQCRDTAARSSASVEVHAATRNTAKAGSTINLDALCLSPVGASVACSITASPASICAVTQSGALRFTAVSGTCTFSVTTPGANATPITYRHTIKSRQRVD